MKYLTKITLLIIAVLFLTTPVYAEDVYVGIGGTYAYENFDAGVDYSNTEGLNLKAGYIINDNLAIELNYDYLQDFKYSGEIISATADVETLILAVKISTGEKVKPYIVGGLGVMRGELTASTGQSESETDMCAKSGVGVDYFVTDDVSVGIEGAYVWGFNDLEGVEYTQIICGVSYHF